MPPRSAPKSDTEPEDVSSAEESYSVTSDNCVIGPRGSIVTADQLKGLHVEALVEGGHLTPTTDLDSAADGDGDPDPDASTKGI